MADINLFRKVKIGRCVMRMKPKSTTLSPRALLYKRFTSLERSFNLLTLYNTISNGLFWTFDNLTLTFTQWSGTLPQGTSVIQVEDFETILQYKTTYFRYTGLEWKTIESIEDEDITLLSATFNNIAKYQLNRYYYVGSFDFMVKGSVEGTNTQFIKGNIIPLTSLNIKHFDDNIHLTQDDLVVIEDRLYSVENPSTDIKHQPKNYNIYFATLNSIL